MLINRHLASLLFVLPLTFAEACAQQTAVTIYDLVNVRLLPNISHPYTTVGTPMSGTFEWTYTVGDFDNGTGLVTAYSIPWWGGQATINAQAEIDSIEFTMQGSFHNLGLDVMLKFTTDLDPWLPAPIDLAQSNFDIQSGGTHKGIVVSGSIVPRCPVIESYGTGTGGSGGFVPSLGTVGEPALGSSNFAIAGSQFLGGTACIAAIAPNPSQLPVLGFTLLVDPTTAVTALMTATGTAGVAGVGTMQLPIAIPNLPALVGEHFHSQVLALDANAPGGLLSASNGVSLFVCN